MRAQGSSMLSSMTAASTSELACQTPAGMQAINSSKHPARTQPSLQPRTHTAASSMLPTLACTWQFFGDGMALMLLNTHKPRPRAPQCISCMEQPCPTPLVVACSSGCLSSQEATEFHCRSMLQQSHPHHAKTSFCLVKVPLLRPNPRQSLVEAATTGIPQLSHGCEPVFSWHHPVPQGVQQRICRSHSFHTLCG